MSTNLQVVQTNSGEPILAVIERAARDPSVDVDKMAKLLEMAEKIHARQAESAFDAAMSATQSEMRPVARDCNNPQTRSQYASYGALDQAVRPIYSVNGFALSFGTRSTVPDRITVTCRISHRAGHSRDVEIDMPSDGKGAKGGDVMTKTHATGSAVSYGMRYLLKMIFNIALGEFDDDGNAAGRTKKPEPPPPKPNGDKPLNERVQIFSKWLYDQVGAEIAGWAIAYLRTHTPDGSEASSALMPNEDLTGLSEVSLAAIRKDMVGFLNRLKAFAEGNKPKAPNRFTGTDDDFLQDGEKRITDIVNEVTEKKGTTKGKPWTLFSIRLGTDHWFSTFSKSVGEMAKKCQGNTATIFYIEEEKGNTATAIKTDAGITRAGESKE